MFTRSAITPPEVNGFGWSLGNSEYIVWSCPWQILGAIRAEAVARARAEIFFCPLNDVRFHRFPVGQISQNLHKKTCFRVLLWGFGKHLWKFGVKGHFSQKNSIFAWSKSTISDFRNRFLRKDYKSRKVMTGCTPVECWLSIDTVGMNSKWFPWHVTPAHGERFFSQKYSFTTSMIGDDFTACCITLNAVSRRGLMTSHYNLK